MARREVEREMILNALEETHWNRKRAAEKLKVSYKAFRNKLRELSIDNVR
jgi:two-component system, NtrC family, response regulator PilR